MAAKIPTPIFDQCARYDMYETEVKAWCEVTSVEKEKRAVVLVLAMTEKKGELLESLKLDDLKKNNGVDVLLEYLKANYGKDELVECLDNYEDFRNFNRQEGQTMADYCSGFQQRVKRITAKGITFPNEILAFELIRNARISSDEKKLVLTGLDFSQKNEMYKCAIASLKKFAGDGCSSMKEEFCLSPPAIKATTRRPMET